MIRQIGRQYLIINAYESTAGLVESVTGLNTDNTDPLNPIVQISVDGVTVTGDGTPGSPLSSTDADTTYDLTSAQDVNDVNITLTGSDATTDIVKLVAGTNITLCNYTKYSICI
jgi:hypothetical protein